MEKEKLEFDVCIIGGGPAGFAAAMRAWDFGAKVCIVEKGSLGGTSIYNGVLSSKTLWELSLDYREALRINRGYRCRNVELLFQEIRSEAQRGMQEKNRQMRKQVEALSKPIADNPGYITLVEGYAKFLDPHSVVVENEESNSSRTIEAKNFVIATGSRPRTLDMAPPDDKYILTTDTEGAFEDFPKSAVVVGAGVVGCEFATVFANFGQTKVHLIDRANRILPFEDEDISSVCARNLEAKGVTIHREANLRSLEPKDGQVEYTIEYPTGAYETIKVDAALVSIGRIPNTDKLDLEKAGVELDERGYIKDKSTVTSVPHIFAAGDVTNHPALVNVGEIEGRHAVERIYKAVDGPLSYANLSTIMFLDPELAAVGLNELQAQEKKISYRVATYGYALVNRAIAMRETDGFVKVIASDDEGDMKILGMRALGVHASTTIEAIALAIAHGINVRDFGELVHPHPSITEAVQECIRMLQGSSIYKPLVFPENLRLSRVTFD